MFNKRDQIEQDQDPSNAPASPPQPSQPAGRSSSQGPTATIGASVHIKGEVQGEENLVIEGHVDGVVNLKSHTLTIGNNGKVKAEIFAHVVQINGEVNGDVVASEQINISQSARVEGNLLAPRISLQDGARFRGSIDMDTESEKFRNTFNHPANINKASANNKPGKSDVDSKPASSTDVKQSASSKEISGAA